MTNTIVVGVDASSTAYKAAQVARDLALALHAPLLVVSAFDSDRTEVRRSGTEEFVLSAADEAERVAAGVANRLRVDGLDIAYSTTQGKAADALVSEADRVKAHIVVVGNRRMRGIGRVLGSIASSVAHNASCDVYIANTYDSE